MTSYPPESSLVVNATQQQLSGSGFTGGVAIAPTQREEADGGYDITFETATRLELQYKAVYREISDREFEPRTSRPAVRFPFNGNQARTLFMRQPAPGTAFYVLPVITDVSGLSDVLGTAVFVDVAALGSLRKPLSNLEDYTGFYVPISKRSSSPTLSAVYLKDKHEPNYTKPRAYDRIDRQFLYSWADVRQLSQANLLGIPVRMRGAMTPAEGYQRQQAFERLLARPTIDETGPSGMDIDDFHRWEDIDELIQVRATTGEAIHRDRPWHEEITAELREGLEAPQYPREFNTNLAQHRNALREVLGRDSDESGQRGLRGAAALDPRMGSRHRQYRFLTSGDKAESIEVPVGV